jgi:RNA polymerase sigma-70 factor (ECF subfamily)
MFPHGRGLPLQFRTTSWSLVISAGQQPTAAAAAAFANLCRIYWYPVYAFVRRRGYDVDDACDLTQEFFARVLEHNYLSTADPARGRFRSFLLTAVRHFLTNEWNREHAQKRGGGAARVSFDLESAEGRYSMEPADKHDPEKLYQRQWAIALLDEVLAALRQEYTKDGKSGQFDTLAPLLTGTDDIVYPEVARQWNCSEGAARVAVHRARKKYRALLRQMIAETVSDPAEIDDEIRFLISAMESSE